MVSKGNRSGALPVTLHARRQSRSAERTVASVRRAHLVGDEAEHLAGDGEHLALAHAASREAIATAARYHGRTPPWALRLLGPRAMRALTRLAPRATPFDLETYLRVHFTKVGDQTLHHLETLVRRGDEYGVTTDALATLRARLLEARAREHAPMR